jgi:RNA polymerase sigma-70 factor (ECF subfamily)
VEVAEIEAAIDTLPDGARDVLILAGIYGYSHVEIAPMLGVAEGTCKAQLHRARRLLRERLNMEAA